MMTNALKLYDQFTWQFFFCFVFVISRLWYISINSTYILLFLLFIARTLVPHLICDTYNPQNTENDFDPHQRSPTMLPDPDNLSDVYMPSRHYSQNVRFCEGTAM